MISLENNKADGASTECINIYGSSSASKKVCNTAINMCKTIDYSLGLTPQLAVEIVL